MFKSRYAASLILFLLLIGGGYVQADNTATQDININVEPINELSVDSAGTLNIDVNADTADVSAGDDSFTVIDDSTTMSYTTNQENMNITAKLDNSFINNIEIDLKITPESNTEVEYSENSIELSNNTARDIITDINNASDSNMIIEYEITVYPETSDVLEHNTVIFTLTDE